MIELLEGAVFCGSAIPAFEAASLTARGYALLGEAEQLAHAR
jgi:hypothetical protein